MLKSPYSNSIIEKLKHDTAIIRLAQDLISVHEKFIAKMEEMDGLINKKVWPKGDKGDRGEKGLKGDKGDKGDDGKDGYVFSREEILGIVKPIIPKIKETKTVITDSHIDQITEKVSKKIKFPSPTIVKNELDIENLLSLLDKAPKGKKLRIDFIEGLEQTIQSLSSQITSKGYLHGGGISKLVEGANVTITDNGNGSFTITSAGGSFTELAATETPNGMLKVFTFPTASAKPSFIISDGVWLQATSKAGDVNWTWNAGTLKATMAIPPSSDIIGIA